jgi:hypothetical protein
VALPYEGVADRLRRAVPACGSAFDEHMITHLIVVDVAALCPYLLPTSDGAPLTWRIVVGGQGQASSLRVLPVEWPFVQSSGWYSRKMARASSRLQTLAVRQPQR